jgi:hypothetical protein
MEDGEEEIEKNKRKSKLSLGVQQTLKRDCQVSPARINEDLWLERSGVREWPGRSRSSGALEEGGSRCPFLVRIKT